MSDLISFPFGGHGGSSGSELGFWCAFPLLGLCFRSFFFLSYLALDMELGAFCMHAHKAIILLSCNMPMLGLYVREDGTVKSVFQSDWCERVLTTLCPLLSASS